MKGKIAGRVKELFISLLCNKIINFIMKLFLIPIAKCRLLPKIIALHCPAVGNISALLPTGQRLFMENEGRDGVANSIHWLGVEGYEPGLVKIWVDLARRSNVIFDIGAYTGLYSLSAALVNSKARVFAFEPVDMQYRCLKRNIEINNLNNIIPVKRVVRSVKKN
jgi:hypothetical protein